MATKHPLKFFSDLIERKHFNDIKANFFYSAMDVHPINPSEPSYDLTEEWILCIEGDKNGQGFSYEFYFKDFLANKLENEKYKAIDDIDLLLCEQDNVPRSLMALATLKSRIDKIEMELSSFQEALKYPFLVTILNDLNNHITSEIERLKNENPLSDSITIKWRAKKNLLAQLFFDLRNGQDGNPSFIDVDKKLLDQFIHKHFRDSNGLQLKENTFEKYMRQIDDEGKRPDPDLRFTFPPFKKD